MGRRKHDFYPTSDWMSEMLSLIWESINEVEDAEVLLSRMEKAGMKPPGWIQETTYANWTGTDTELHRVKKEGWEPENE